MRPLSQLAGMKWSTMTPGYSEMLPRNTLRTHGLNHGCDQIVLPRPQNYEYLIMVKDDCPACILIVMYQR